MTATTPGPPIADDPSREDSRPVMLVLSTRVGHAAGIPPGSTTTLCSLCGAAAWLTPFVTEIAETFGLEVVAVCDDQAGHMDNRG